jgi:hypothetical protein
MTQAQKTAKAKFKQAIAYRQKTGVSLKEAFAHIYGKKVGAVNKKSAPKKKAAKKVIKKKVAKKVVKKKYGLNPKKDKLYEAKKPGKRLSKTGKTYYESRENRSDKGKVYGIGYSDKQKHTILKEIEDGNKVILEQKKNLEYLTKCYKTNKSIIEKKLLMIDIKTLKNNFIPYNTQKVKKLQILLKKLI